MTALFFRSTSRPFSNYFRAQGNAEKAHLAYYPSSYDFEDFNVSDNIWRMILTLKSSFFW